VDESVLGDVWGDDEGWNTDTESGEVVRDIVGIRDTVEGHTVLWSWDADWWVDVVGETSVLVEVDDDQRVLPVLRLTDCVVQVLDHLRTSGHVGRRVHGVDGAALWVDVAELWESTLLEVSVELVGGDKLVHVVVLNMLVHESIDDISLVLC